VRTFTRLAQSVERQPFKLVVVGSSPTSGDKQEAIKTVKAGGLSQCYAGRRHNTPASIMQIVGAK
jgi:hypothetical protein